MPRFTFRASAAVLAVGCAVALTGCTSDPGAAALIGKSITISDRQLHDLVDETLANKTFASQSTADRASVTRVQLTSLVQLALLKAAAAKAGITVSAAELSAYTQNVASQYGGLAALQKQAAEEGTPPQLLPDALLESLLVSKLSTAVTGKSSPGQSAESHVFLAAMVAETKTLGVHISPRYGVWVADKATIDPPGDTLSRPAFTPKPVASAPGSSSSG